MKNPEYIWYLAAVTEVVSVFLVFRIWKSFDSRFFKILRTLFTLIPIVGPVFYAFTGTPPNRLRSNLMDKPSDISHMDHGYTPNYSRKWEREKPELERKIRDLEEKS